MVWGGIRKFVGRAAVKDTAKFIAAPDDLGLSGSVIAKATQVAKDLNALALDLPVTPELAPIDNSQESPEDAKLRLEFAFSERLSLDYSYRDVAKQPRIIPVLEEDEVVRHYQILKLHSGHGGIVGNILIPAQQNESARIYVNFCGTQPHVLSSVHLNFEHCAGEDSFYAHHDQMMGQINELIGQVSASSKKPIQLIFSGHSLGGALSQHAHYSAMLLASQKTTLAHFAKVHSFTLNSWGMAGVSKTIATNSNRIADELHAKGKTITARFGFNELDMVPRCGEANTLVKSKGDVALVVVEDKSMSMTRSVVSGCIDGAVTGSMFGGFYGAVVGVTTMLTKGLAPINAAHNNFHYGPYGELLANMAYKISRNSTPLGRQKIIHAFDNKLSVLQKPLLVKAKNVLQQAGEAGANFKLAATGHAVMCLRAVYRVAPKLR
ncbi:MAG: hypothetical protein AB7I18_06265 [Candidatus Berkiella sp.]